MNNSEIKTAQKNLERLSDAGFTLIELKKNEIKTLDSIDVFLNN